MKSLAEKLADEGLASYIVTINYDGSNSVEQYWAEDEAHAREQCEDSNPGCDIGRVELQDQFELRTGVVLNYGRTPTL
jgi:hypothetical protein